MTAVLRYGESRKFYDGYSSTFVSRHDDTGDFVVRDSLVTETDVAELLLRLVEDTGVSDETKGAVVACVTSAYGATEPSSYAERSIDDALDAYEGDDGSDDSDGETGENGGLTDGDYCPNCTCASCSAKRMFERVVEENLGDDAVPEKLGTAIEAVDGDDGSDDIDEKQWPTNDDGYPVCIECGGLLDFSGECPNGHRMSELGKGESVGLSVEHINRFVEEFLEEP